jgi:hypothetical protein
VFHPRPRKPQASLEERAVRWIIHHQDMTYEKTAALFGVTVNNIRSRIEYRYGSLSAARYYGLADEGGQITDRTCLVCRTTKDMSKSQYICDTCKKESL